MTQTKVDQYKKSDGSYDYASMALDVGYGNAAKLVASTKNGSFSASDLPTIGLNINVGNLNAISGGGPGGGGAMTQDEFEKKRASGDEVVLKRDSGVWSAPTAASSITVNNNFTLPVTVDGSGQYKLGNADTFNLVGQDNTKNYYIQEQLKKAYVSCADKNNCAISVEA